MNLHKCIINVVSWANRLGSVHGCCFELIDSFQIELTFGIRKVVPILSDAMCASPAERLALGRLSFLCAAVFPGAALLRVPPFGRGRAPLLAVCVHRRAVRVLLPFVLEWQDAFCAICRCAYRCATTLGRLSFLRAAVFPGAALLRVPPFGRGRSPLLAVCVHRRAVRVLLPFV